MMNKLATVIGQFISTNMDNLMKDWEKERECVSIWHNGPIDEGMLESVNSIIQTSIKEGKNPEKIDLVVNSYGGFIEPAYQISCLLDKNFKDSQINFVVPRVAKSAATLIACGCNKILFSQVGELGPLDVQIKRGEEVISGITIKRLVDKELKGENTNENMKEWIYKTLKPEEVLEMERFNEVAVKYLEELLPRRMFPGKASKSKEIQDAIKELCDKFPSHSFVIDHDTAKNKLNFNVEHVSDKEELILQNIRELWDYQNRLEKVIHLNLENQILKKNVKELLRRERK